MIILVMFLRRRQSPDSAPDLERTLLRAPFGKVTAATTKYPTFLASVVVEDVEGTYKKHIQIS